MLLAAGLPTFQTRDRLAGHGYVLQAGSHIVFSHFQLQWIQSRWYNPQALWFIYIYTYTNIEDILGSMPSTSDT